MKITAIADRDVGQVWGATFEANSADVLPIERVVANAGFLLRAADQNVFISLPLDGLETVATENAALLVSPRGFGVLDGVVVGLPSPTLDLSATASGITITGVAPTEKHTVKGYYAKESDPHNPTPLPPQNLTGSFTYTTTELVVGKTYRIVMMVKQIGTVTKIVTVTAA